MKGLTEEPQTLPNVLRVLAVMAETTQGANVWEEGVGYSVSPIAVDAPQDALAATKHQSSTRYYTHEYDLPEGWRIWGWQEFGRYDWRDVYEVRDAQGRRVEGERIYGLARAKDAAREVTA